MKKICVICSGWHYPYQFYNAMNNQKIPKGWDISMFCISHRNYKYAKIEKENRKFVGSRAYLDEQLYTSIITDIDIEYLNWNYKEYPNTIGDWGCFNQWLSEYDYNLYDLFLFTHDDNLILSCNWLSDIINSKNYDNWEILSNSSGAPKGWLRGSCEFFKPSILKKLGGKFDLSEVKLKRINEKFGAQNLNELSDWNKTVTPLMNFIHNNNISIHFSSNWYRVSKYCIEGERGYISNTTGNNTISENEGLSKLNVLK